MIRVIIRHNNNADGAFRQCDRLQYGCSHRLMCRHSANISDRQISPTDIFVGRQIPVWAKLLDTNYGDDYDL